MPENTWDPFDELRKMQHRIGRIIGELPERAGHEEGKAPGMQVPDVDVIERGNSVVITADMPGVDKNDIMINVRDGNVLEISAEKKTEMKEEGERGFIRHERSYSHYYRSVTLPSTVDKSGAKATYNNGVLEVTLPVVERSSTSDIPVS